MRIGTRGRRKLTRKNIAEKFKEKVPLGAFRPWRDFLSIIFIQYQGTLSKVVLGLFLGILFVTSQSVNPQGGPPPETLYNIDWNERLSPNLGLKPHDHSLLGDHIDKHTGGLSFEHVDISIPGNSGLAVEIRRRRNPSQSNNNEFADWQLAVPMINTKIHKTEFIKGERWGKKRCSDKLVKAIPDARYAKENISGGSIIFPANYSDGVNLDVPGQGAGQLLDKTVSEGWPEAAKKVTAKGWYFTCIPNIDGAGTEGFYGYSPTGDRYRFDVVRVRRNVSKIKIGVFVTSGYAQYHTEPVYYDGLAASEVVDVHGNWVRYVYTSTGQLTRIEANDGRRIDLTYRGDRVLEVIANPGSADERRWSYTYGSTSATMYVADRYQFDQAPTYERIYNLVLEKVTLPNGQSWTFDMGGLYAEAVTGTKFTASDTGELVQCRQVDQTVSLVHPNGMVGTFEIKERTRFLPSSSRSGPSCPMARGGGHPNIHADVMAVVKKTLSAEGVPTAVWQYSYANTATGLPGEIEFNRTTTIRPDSTRTVSYFKPPPAHTSVRKEELYDSITATTPIQVTTNTYFLESVAGSTFPSSITQDTARPLRKIGVEIARGNDRYHTRQTYNTDRSASNYSYGWPTKIEKWSSLGSGTRITDMTYIPDTDNWILGLLDTVTRNGKLFDDYDYDTKGRLETHKRFGITQASLAFYTSGPQAGLLRSYKDALNRETTYESWHRGNPQVITYADNTSFRLGIDDNSWVTQSTNGRGITTYYDYDEIGQLTRIDRPAPWEDTHVSYTQTGAKLVQETTRGNEVTTTTFDAMLRPVEVQRKSLSGSNTPIYLETAYDAMGRTAFTSLPTAFPGATTGIETDYDAFGRIAESGETAAGGGKTTYAYLPGNKIQITDPLGIPTTHTHSGFGDPDDGNVIRTEKPEGITVDQSYNIHGKILSIAQKKENGSTHNSAFHYDDRNRVCRRSIPETGDTLYRYNNADQLTAYAEGQELGSGCSALPGEETIQLTYNPRGHLDTTDYPAPFDDIKRAYDANGNLTSIVRGGTAWTYRYNDIELPANETLRVDSNIYEIGYGYNDSGILIHKTFPSGKKYDFDPDGLGRPLSVSAGSERYLDHIGYHPNGKIEYLYRGNGGEYDQRLNARQLVSHIGGSWGAAMSYVHDERGRVTTINSADSAYDRIFTYDDAGRLEFATGPWGAGSYAYDALNNLKKKTLGARQVDIEYDDSLNRVSRVRDSAKSGAWRNYRYDSRGNVTEDGRHKFRYDFANQPVSVSGKDQGKFTYDGNLRRVKEEINGKTIYSIYDQSGALLTREENSIVLIYQGGGLNIPITVKTVTDHISLGGQTFVRVKNGKASYPLNDHLGSAYSVADENGEVSASQVYNFTPFGEAIGNDPGACNQRGFTGHVEDQTGLTYMQARYYDPVIGRFLQTDPIGYEDQLNLYAYVHNDPINYTDPTGEFGVFGAFFGGGVELGMQLLKNGGDLSKVDWADVAVSAAVGAIAPGMLSTGKTVFKSANAAKTLSKQANKARTSNRRQKLDRRINSHKANIKTAVTVQTGWQVAKAAGKKLADTVEGMTNGGAQDTSGSQGEQSDTKRSDNGMTGGNVRICSGTGAQKRGC